MNIKSILVCFLLCIPVFATDVMVERMEGVIDEVRELRERYEAAVHKNEACISTVKEQEVLLMQKGLSPSTQNQHIKELELENSKLNEALQAAKVQNEKYKRLQEDFQSLEKEKARLNASAAILVEKNHALLTQVNNFKRSSNEAKDTTSVTPLKDNEKLLEALDAHKKKVDTLEQVNSDLISGNEKFKTQIEILLSEKEILVKELESREHKGMQRDETLQGKMQVCVNAKSVSVCPEYSALQKDNDALLKELETCRNHSKKPVKKVQTSATICIDDNPFPVLLKDENAPEPKTKPMPREILTPEPKERASGVYRIKGESAVYNAPKGSVIEIWEDTRSFTSNMSKDNWIKITGYFIDRKWMKADSELWVEENNTLKR